MKERPIIFDGESVRAILEGRKTQTRRVLQLLGSITSVEWNKYGRRWFTNLGGRGFKCPYGQPGDRLWVRETWAVAPLAIHYKADNVFKSYPDEPRLYDCVSTKGWRSPIFMPRWASRITLKIVGVRVERLQDISEQDALAEGWPCGDMTSLTIQQLCASASGLAAIDWFASRWDSLNAKRGFPWESNPWIWVVEFELV